MGQPRGRAKPASSGPDHDSIRPHNRHFTSQAAPRGLIRAVLDLDHCIIIRLAVQIISCDKGLDNGFSAAQPKRGENEVPGI